MSATNEFNFTHADYQALHYFLIDAASPDLASRAANIPSQQFKDGVLSAIVPCLRGNHVDFERFVNAKNILDGDRLRLDYEVRLSQLNRQHQMCIDAYRRTDEYAQRQLAIHNTQKDAEPLRQKSLTGDIRFLQLARNIRHEMDVLEKKLDERLDQLHEWQHRANSRPKPAAPPEAQPAPTSTHSPAAPPPSPLTPPQPKTQQPAENPTKEAQFARQEHCQRPHQAEIKAPVAAQILKPTSQPDPLLRREDLLAALSVEKTPKSRLRSENKTNTQAQTAKSGGLKTPAFP